MCSCPFEARCIIPPAPIIRQHPKEPRRELSLVRWGLIPWWAKDASGSAKMINARSETAATKPAFRDSVKSRRCIVPADAFYEWQRTRTGKQAFCFKVHDGELFAFAGLWDRWKDPSGETLETCSILTPTPTPASVFVSDPGCALWPSSRGRCCRQQEFRS
jgi:putative SOS response-associated peptidase YedK